MSSDKSSIKKIGPVRSICDSYSVKWKYQFITSNGLYGVAHENGHIRIPPEYTELEYNPHYQLFLARKSTENTWGAFYLDGTERASFKHTKEQLLDRIERRY